MIRKVLLLIAIGLVFNISYAQTAGSLVSSFGDGGKTFANAAFPDFMVHSQAIQADGKIVMAGGYYNGVEVEEGFVVRLNADGTLDTTFNGTGKIIKTTPGGYNVVKIQPDGKILIGGDFQDIMRYTEQGAVDTAFGYNGSVLPEFNGQYKDVVDIAIKPDGKIIAVISDDQTGQVYDYIISAYNADGSADTTFDEDGTLTTDIGFNEHPKSIALLADGRIVVGGDYVNNTSGNYETNLFVARYNADGSMDDTLNNTGVKYFGIAAATYDNFDSMAIQPDGKMIITGKAQAGSQFTFVTRLNNDGSVDNTFGDGINMLELSFIPANRGKVKIQPDGKIVYSESYFNFEEDGIQSILLVRYNTNGTLDTSFGNQGKLGLSFSPGNNYIADFDITATGILVSGNSEISPFEKKLAVAKLNSNGALDNSFGDVGILTFSIFHQGYDHLNVIVLQNDGKILAGGVSQFSESNFVSSVVRFNADGTRDNTFGDQGSVLINLTGVQGLIQDPNGKIIVANSLYGLVGLNEDGTLNTAFGTDGFLQLDFSQNMSVAITDMKLLPDGKIIIAGMKEGNNPFLAKITTTGVLDPAFGTGGISEGGLFNNQTEKINAIKVQNDGKIVVVGSIFNGIDDDMAIYRYNPNGTLDNSFGIAGMAEITDGTAQGYEAAYDVDIQADGKIVVKGQMINGGYDYVVVRLTNTGLIDTTFGNEGHVYTTLDYTGPPFGIRVTSDQKIIVTGLSQDLDSNFGAGIVKLNADGSRDTAFGEQGKVFVAFDDITACIITEDAKLLVGGSAPDPSGSSIDFAIAKLNLEAELGIDEAGKNDTIDFYPNPAVTNITFSEDVLKVSIYTLDGRMVNTVLKDNQIDVQNLAQGIYIVNLTKKDGGLVSKKLIRK